MMKWRPARFIELITLNMDPNSKLVLSGIPKSCGRTRRRSRFSLQLVGGVAFGLLCNLLFLGCRPPREPGKPPEALPLSIQTAQPTRGPITRFVTLPGEIKPYQQATLFAKVAGYLKSITVDKGDQVKEGVLLAEIEVPELLADRARYKAEIEVAQLDFQRL